eukprot:c31140_g1_i1 orf=1-207(-)
MIQNLPIRRVPYSFLFQTIGYRNYFDGENFYHLNLLVAFVVAADCAHAAKEPFSTPPLLAFAVADCILE